MEVPMLNSQGIQQKLAEWDRLQAESRRIDALPPKHLRNRDIGPLMSARVATTPVAAPVPAPLSDEELMASVHESERPEAARDRAAREYDSGTTRWKTTLNRADYIQVRSREVVGQLKSYTG